MAVLRPGSRWRSATGTTEVVVVRAPSEDVVLECGGAPMVPLEEAPAAPAADDGPAEDPVLLGKRYEDPEAGVEVLCSKPGPGPLAANGRALEVKAAKPLPSSD